MKRIAFLVALAALSACSAANILAPPGEPAKLYTLSPPPAATTAASPARWQLLIAAPEAPLDLNSVRIAIEPTAGRIDYYADVAWADRPPAMLQDLLLQSFDGSGRITAVQRQSGGLKADFVLTSEIHDFQIEAGAGDPVAHLRISARLVRTRDRTIVASKSFEISQHAGPTFDGAIAAFDSGLKMLLPQMVDWTLNLGGANP